MDNEKLRAFTAKLRSLTIEGWTSYVVITVALLILLVVVGLSTQYIMERRGEDLTSTHILDDKLRLECAVAGAADRVAFINDQRSQISRFANGDRKAAIQFFTYFYTSYLEFTIFGLIAAISLAVIAKVGINSVSPHLMTVFLVSTAVVVLYQGAFGIFQQKTNAENNAKLAVSYAVLADQIDTYCVTGKVNVQDPSEAFLQALPKRAASNNGGKPSTQGSPGPGLDQASSDTQNSLETKIPAYFVQPSGDEFINYIAWQMEHLRTLSIAIDDTKLTTIDNKKFLVQ